MHRVSVYASGYGVGADNLRRAPPRGLGVVTATTSAAFFPDHEQRIRNASSLSVTFPVRPQMKKQDGEEIGVVGGAPAHPKES
jgi:hypothetical protein